MNIDLNKLTQSNNIIVVFILVFLVSVFLWVKKNKMDLTFSQGYGFSSSQGCGFSSGCVWMWELDCEESWAPKNWCFWTVGEKTLESPCKEI